MSKRAPMYGSACCYNAPAPARPAMYRLPLSHLCLADICAFERERFVCVVLFFIGVVTSSLWSHEVTFVSYANTAMHGILKATKQPRTQTPRTPSSHLPAVLVRVHLALQRCAFGRPPSLPCRLWCLVVHRTPALRRRLARGPRPHPHPHPHPCPEATRCGE
jgi:hypothetical protein